MRWAVGDVRVYEGRPAADVIVAIRLACHRTVLMLIGFVVI